MVEKENQQSKKTESERPSWDDLYTKLKVFKNNGYGWNQVWVSQDDDTGEVFLRLRKAFQNFNIKNQKHYNIVLSLLRQGADSAGWTTDLDPDEIQNLIEEKESIESIKNRSNEMIEKQRNQIDTLLSQVGRLREQQFTFQLDQFKKDLKEFKNLLKKEEDEKKIQQWLFEHTWLFGPSYIDGVKEELNRKGNRIDFLLQRYDTYYDIVELKLPSCKLFVGKDEATTEKDISRKYRMSADVKDAISQVIGYLETYELDKTNILWEKNISIHKPKGVIVIGRSSKEEKRALKTLNSYFHNIEIYTYDDFIELGNNFIKLIESRQG